jgi:hypothetical protein
MWIAFKNMRPSATGKTRIWDVRATADETYLGHISWHGAWRKYVFFPAAGTLFEEDCLHAIADFCWKQTDTHRREASNRKHRGE